MSPRIVLGLFLIFSIFNISVSITCHECVGFQCNRNSSSSKVIVCHKSVACFVLLTHDNFLSYRGCFMVGGYYYKTCKEHMYTRCRLCHTSLCNDWDTVDTRSEISCGKCEKGLCSPTKPLISFRKCPYFMHPEPPQCFSMVDRMSNEYTFGCVNEMTREQRTLCDMDWFHSVCKYCDTPNCNSEFFRGSNMNSLSCYNAANSESKRCEITKNWFPYWGCYTSNLGTGHEKYGCLASLFTSIKDKKYHDLFTTGKLDSAIVVCFTSNCNGKFDINNSEFKDATIKNCF